MITSTTGLLGVIGDPVSHSLGPVIHNAALRELGIDSVYLAFRVEKPAGALDAMRTLGLRGLSVTIPHKEAVAGLVDRLADSARASRSVNTVVNDGGILTGHSTDGPGALQALKDGGFEPNGATATILGAGGAARAVAFALLDSGARRISIEARSRERAERLRDDLESRRAGSASVGFETSDLLVNATPVGMHPRVGESPLDPASLAGFSCVMETIYNPLETRLLAAARVAGLGTVDGLGMFIEQAALQFELFTGLAPSRAIMRAAAAGELARRG